MISEDFGAGFGLFFCLSWITLLVGYIPMFLAFLKLRKVDAKKERPYRAPFEGAMAKVAAYIQENIPLLAGVVLSFIIEEILVARIKTKKAE